MTDPRVFSIRKWGRAVMTDALVASKKSIKQCIADLEDDLTQPAEFIFQLVDQGKTTEQIEQAGRLTTWRVLVMPEEFQPMTEEEYKAYISSTVIPKLKEILGRRQ